MDELHIISMSANDAERMATIIASVPGISSPQQAVSWALNNVSIPPGTELRLFECEWKPARPDTVNLVPLPIQMRKAGIVKIDVCNLAGLKGSAIMETDVLKQIASTPTDRAAALQDAKFGFWK